MKRKNKNNNNNNPKKKNTKIIYLFFFYFNFQISFFLKCSFSKTKKQNISEPNKHVEFFIKTFIYLNREKKKHFILLKKCLFFLTLFKMQKIKKQKAKQFFFFSKILWDVKNTKEAHFKSS